LPDMSVRILTVLLTLARKITLLHSPNSQPPPFRMRWYSFSASSIPGSARPQFPGDTCPGIFLIGSPFARVCRSAGTHFPAINLESAVTKTFRANSRAINTSEINGFKSTEMNTCEKYGVGCRSPNALVSSWLPDYSSGVREELSSRGTEFESSCVRGDRWLQLSTGGVPHRCG
jgi:hypothetical protein